MAILSKLNNDGIRTPKERFITDEPSLVEDINSFGTLHRAIMKGKTKKVFRYLSQRNKSKKINKQDVNGRCALHLVAASGNVDLLRLILNMENVQVEIKDEKGRTPFFIACQHNHLQCMKEVVTHGASAKSRDNDSETPLHYLVNNYKEDLMPVIDYLIDECNIFIDGKNGHGYTPMHLVAKHGHTELIQYLIEHKADINLLDANGNTPLSIAVTCKHLETAEALRFFGGKECSEVHERQNDPGVKTDKSELELKLEELVKQRDIVLSSHAEIKSDNTHLQQKVEHERKSFEEANPKKRKNIIHGITKKSSRLVLKYVPKQTCKHLNERERKEESEKLYKKYGELEDAYSNVSLNTEELNCKALGYKEDITCLDSFNNKDHDNATSIEVQKIKAKHAEETEETNLLRATIKDLRTKYKETKRKIASFTGKSTEQRDNLQNEVNGMKSLVKEKEQQLEEFNNGKLDKLREILKCKQQEIQDGEELQCKLVNKYKQLKAKYEQMKVAKELATK